RLESQLHRLDNAGGLEDDVVGFPIRAHLPPQAEHENEGDQEEPEDKPGALLPPDGYESDGTRQPRKCFKHRRTPASLRQPGQADESFANQQIGPAELVEIIDVDRSALWHVDDEMPAARPPVDRLGAHEAGAPEIEA